MRGEELGQRCTPVHTDAPSRERENHSTRARRSSKERTERRADQPGNRHSAAATRTRSTARRRVRGSSGGMAGCKHVAGTCVNGASVASTGRAVDAPEVRVRTAVAALRVHPTTVWPACEGRSLHVHGIHRHRPGCPTDRGQKPTPSRIKTTTPRSGRASRSRMRILPMNEVWPWFSCSRRHSFGRL